MLNLLPRFVPLTAALLLGGCAALNRVDNEVSTYSQWPAQRQPASYVFERLPSQQSRVQQQQQLEDAARPALATAGFTQATDAASAEFSVQLGARTTPNERSPLDDPFWWPGGWRHGWGYGGGYGRFGPGYGYGPGWYGGRYDPSSWQREVALLIRDRKSGQVLYETRANNDGFTPYMDDVLPAMFQAAMQDFPSAGANPRNVTVQLPPRQ